MAYKALYRIYRPKSFDEMVGQRHIITTIKNAIRENKIAHAYLFSGPRGTGKTSMAKLLSKALNCTCQDQNNRPCNQCENCTEINNGSHPDIIEIDAASNNGVDEVREIIDKVKYSPILGKYKVYIIDEVHMMTPGAFNALLKTLEEPPAHVVFILATTDVHKVIPTIVSRCQRFDFGRVGINDIKSRIKEVLDCEAVTYDGEIIETIADLAEGGMRDALSILDQTLAYAGNNITVQHIRDIYGIATTNELIDFLNCCHNNDVLGVLNTIKDFENKGLDFVRLTSTLIDILKESIIYYKTKEESLLKLLNAQKALALSSKLHSDDLFADIDILIEAQANYRRVNTPKDFFQLAALKICDLYGTNQPVRQMDRPADVTPKSIINTPYVAPNANIEKNKEQVVRESESTYQQVITTPKTETVNNDVTNQTSTVATKVEEIIEPKMPEVKKVVQKKICFTDDDLINLLVQATQTDKAMIIEKWTLIRKYMSIANFAKAANLIIDGQPTAVCKNAILFVFDLEAQADIINIASNQAIIRDLLKEIYGKDFYFYGISNDTFKKIRFQFVDKKNSNALPPPRPIGEPYSTVIEDDEQPKNNENLKDENLHYFENLFGQKIDVEE